MAERLAMAGFVLAALAFGACLVDLVRGGVVRRGLRRFGALLLLALIASSAWGLFGWLDLSLDRRGWWFAATASDLLRYAAWVGLLLTLLPARPRATWWRAGTALPIVLLLAGWGAEAVLLFDAAQSVAMRTLLVVHLAWAVLGLVLVEQVFRNEAEASRWSVKLLCVALACTFAYDVYLFAQAMMFGAPDSDALAARGLVHALAVPLLIVTFRRRTNWFARVQVSKTVAFYSASLLLIGAYLLLVAAAGYYIRFFGGGGGGVLQVTLLAAAVVVLATSLLSGALRARLRVFLNKHFFRYRYDYRVEWLRFTTMLSSKSTPQEVGTRVVGGLADLVESPAGALWFKGLDGRSFVATAAWNMPGPSATEPIDSPFCRFMREREWIVDLHLKTPSGSKATLPSPPLPEWLSALGDPWLAVPLLVGDEMLGFVILARPRTGIDLNWEVRDLLKTAARQAAGFLALVHATEALVETRKFDAFNRMSAFVVHDLKNIVTQLSLMMRNAERHRDKPEFQRDMLATVENSLDKMRQLMMQLREGETPAGATAGVELAPILQALQQSVRRRGRDLELQIEERVATRGHGQRLERVIDHVVQNALDATPPEGRVWVQLKKVSGRAVIVVGDTGAGMSQQFIQTRLFRPFSSTKTHGMGIGSYETLQYVREIGGGIDVASELGRGSLVTIWMPLFELLHEPHFHVQEG